MRVGTVVNPSISIQESPQSKLDQINFDDIPFGRFFTDHMFVMDYKDGSWQDARILPFDNLSMHPATSAIHYGQSIFEGMKAFRTDDDRVFMFRPEKNIERFNRSAARMAMPDVPEDLFEEALQTLLHLERGWIPPSAGSALYIRPFMFATEEFIGIKVADSYRFMIICCPVGAYYSHPVRVKVAQKFVRACEGGTGFAKAAGNYGAAMLPLKLAKEEGYHQMLWMDAKEFKYTQEIGTMNVFFVVDGKVLTPSTEKGTILEGVTRASAIQLLRDKGYEVIERAVSIDELEEAYDKGTWTEAFGTGTAATITQIEEIGYQDRAFKFPTDQMQASSWLSEELADIRYGRKADPYGWMREITA
jgi:branched-chain amino acid aminotransferase